MAFGSGEHHVVEIAPLNPADAALVDSEASIADLVHEINAATAVQPMLEQTVRLLRLLTGFGRVMVYKFDRDFNGEVVAEVRATTMEPFLGLRFPHWDIPAQARAIMKELPLRLINDVDEQPVKIQAANPDAPPLDIAMAQARGVSPVHLEYLRNMGVQSTMTLSIVFEDKLWGMISFHNRRQRTLSQRLRTLLQEFLLFFNTKMAALENREAIKVIERIEAVKNAIFSEIEVDRDIERGFDKIGPILTDAFDADGVASLSGSQSTQVGRVPGQAVLDRLLHLGKTESGQVFAIENMPKAFPDLAHDMYGLSGALIAVTSKNRAFAIFRRQVTQKITWAGAPEKTVLGTGAAAKLEPRGSFAAYLQEIEGSCAPWSDENMQLARRLWPIVNAVERQVLMNTLNRQQSLMIDELNHRVRNILGLVRAVSHQARRRYGSLNSYAQAIEARIQALAAAHNIGNDGIGKAVSVTRIIEVEIEPYVDDEPGRVDISGEELSIAPEVAPIFALTIHELATNAAKYGAFSTDDGNLSVIISKQSDGLQLSWVERGGPIVVTPEETGFGTVLIQQAVPHELGGRAELFYDPEGVRAELFVPNKLLRENPSVDRAVTEKPDPERETVDVETFDGLALLVEDNFMIAKETADQLSDLGFADVEICSNLVDALDLLQDLTPVVAILDVNLGSRYNSLPIARRLTDLNVPFVFATGYGESRITSEGFDSVLTLTKPVSAADLKSALAEVLQRNVA